MQQQYEDLHPFLHPQQINSLHIYDASGSEVHIGFQLFAHLCQPQLLGLEKIRVRDQSLAPNETSMIGSSSDMLFQSTFCRWIIFKFSSLMSKQFSPCFDNISMFTCFVVQEYKKSFEHYFTFYRNIKWTPRMFAESSKYSKLKICLPQQILMLCHSM